MMWTCSNAFVQTLVSALTDLYSLGEAGITRENWESLDADVRRRHADPGWPEQVIARAGIEEIITDPSWIRCSTRALRWARGTGRWRA